MGAKESREEKVGTKEERRGVDKRTEEYRGVDGQAGRTGNRDEWMG